MMTLREAPAGRPAAVIFDMDGVLVDTEPVYMEVNLGFFRNRGLPFEPSELDEFVGSPGTTMWGKIRKRFSLAEPVEELMRIEAEGFLAHLRGLPRIPPLPGIPELLASIRERGLGIGLASSSRRPVLELVLGKAGLKEYFEFTSAGGEVANGKPAPDAFLEVSRSLGVPPGQCMVIEDSRNGVMGAKAAGMFCVGFRNPNSGNQDISSADLIIGDFSPAARNAIWSSFTRHLGSENPDMKGSRANP